MNLTSTIARSLVGCLLGLGACVGTPADGEQQAREDLAKVRSGYRPGDAAPSLPELTAASPLNDYLRFAVLKHPSIEAAYYDWAAAVERVTVTRSLPDPRLTFETDITRMIESLMPGLMMDLPGPGKLAAAGAAAAQESQASYFGFEQAILRVAVALKTAYYRLHYLEENLRVQRATFALLDDLEQLAQSQNAAGRVTLQDVLRAQIEKEQVRTQIDNLEDSRVPLLAELKAALGLQPDDPDPSIPTSFESSPDADSADVLLRAALARNPALRRMEADVRAAESMLRLAEKSGVPDFALGLEADVKSSPVLLRPSASVSLPVWRDKIAAEIAGVQARKRAAEARLTGEQIAVAAELAVMLFMYRESRREIVIDAQRQLLMFELSLVDARTRRELALASVSLAVVGLPPAGAPVLGLKETER